MNLTLTQLMALSLEPVARAYRRMVLKARLKAAYRGAAHFQEMMWMGSKGMQEMHKEIVMLESDLRRMK